MYSPGRRDIMWPQYSFGVNDTSERAPCKEIILSQGAFTLSAQPSCQIRFSLIQRPTSIPSLIHWWASDNMIWVQKTARFGSFSLPGNMTLQGIRLLVNCYNVTCGRRIASTCGVDAQSRGKTYKWAAPSQGPGRSTDAQ